MIEKLILELKNELNYQLDNIPIKKIYEISKKIEITKNNIYLTGIGKSQNVALHCSTLLKCIGICANYIDPINSLHGDIGTIKKNDIVLLFSKSGNTVELINLLYFLKQQKSFNIGIVCNENSQFKYYCDYLIKLPLNSEMKGNINTIPTNSYISQILFCNILVSYLSKNISTDNYKNNHPSGTIGVNLKTIKEIIKYNFPQIKMVSDEVCLNKILLEMTTYGIGCCFFVDDNKKFLGLLTDGDIRRFILNNSNKKYINIHDINKNFFYENNINKKLLNIDNYSKKKFIPIIEKNILLGIIDFRDI